MTTHEYWHASDFISEQKLRINPFKSRYEFNVEAKILGIPILRAFITVTITDENDNFPVFEKPYDSVSIQWAPNQTIYSLNATDDDEKWNGQIFYRLVEQTELFTIEDSILRSTSIDPGERPRLIEIEVQ